MIPKRMIDSTQFKSLSSKAQLLAILMQTHWTFYKPIPLGVREVAKLLKIGKSTASRVLKELIRNNFIIQENESHFIHCESTGNRPKAYSLTWMPYKKYGTSPTGLWEKNN